MTWARAGLQFARQVLHGFSQCGFQASATAGLLFVLAVAVFNWRMAVFFVVSTVVGTFVARALKGNADLLDLGHFGFNSALMGLALGCYYEPTPALWLWMPILAAVTAAVTVAMSKWMRLPFLGAPFILTLWAVWPFGQTLGLTQVESMGFSAAPVVWGTAVASALGSALLAPDIFTGLLFLTGLLLSNWRHGLVAVLGAFTAVTLAAQGGAPGAAVNSGFVGFNGVLAALAAYIIIGADLRLVVLASVLSTWLASYVHRDAPVPVLASGFVVAIWLMLLLGWLSPRFAGNQRTTEADRG
jgi:urea transporter